MPKEMTLSGEVQAFIQSLDDDDIGLTKEEFAEIRKQRPVVDAIVDDIIRARETISDSKLELLEKLVESSPDLIEGFLDDRFTRDVVGEVPGYVHRTLQLSRLKATDIPSNITNGYLREAVHTYILGLPQASVALSRATLEQALKEKIGYKSSTFIKMNDLLDEAETADVIDKAHRHLARQVADAADDVLHDRPTTLPKSLDVLTCLRGVLQFIYSRA